MEKFKSLSKKEKIYLKGGKNIQKHNEVYG